MTQPTTTIRSYLTAAYSDDNLTALCADYFRDVADAFAAGMTKTQKVQLLLDHCQRRDLFSNLLAALHSDRPEQYQRQFGAIALEPAPAPVPRARDPRHIFISHAHEDADFAYRLAADLQAHGWRVWLAPDSIRPGEKWGEAINRGLEECGVFVVLLTPAAVRSRWVTTETTLAIELEHKDVLRFIPVEVESCRPPLLWTAYQHIPFTPRYDSGLAALLATLDERPTPDTFVITSLIQMEFVRVPAGEFLMGSDPAKDKDAYSNEMPQHRVYVPEFYIGKYPVTNDQYAVFVKATRHDAPDHWKNGQIPANKGNHPVAFVTWHDAVAFCAWLSKAAGQPIRLPTEAEWEKAARGVDGRLYPWGNQGPDKELCNFNKNVNDTTAVGHYPKGASPYGALDMAGNVWEWCSSLWGKDWQKPTFDYPCRADDGREDPNSPGYRISRGGSWHDDPDLVRCAYRGGDDPADGFADFGFRVARSSR